MAAAGCSLAQAARRWLLCRGSSATEQGWWWRWQQLGYGYGGGSLAAGRLRQLGGTCGSVGSGGGGGGAIARRWWRQLVGGA